MNLIQTLEEIKEKYNQDKEKYPSIFIDPVVFLYLEGRELSPSKSLRVLFSNVRYDGFVYTGKSLTTSGNSLFSMFYDCKQYSDVSIIRPKDIIFLEKHSKKPYYLGKKIVIFYDLDLAGLYRLYGSCLTTLVDMHFEDDSIL